MIVPLSVVMGCAVVAAALTRAQRRSALTWGCLGLVSGPIALALV